MTFNRRLDWVPIVGYGQSETLLTEAIQPSVLQSRLLCTPNLDTTSDPNSSIGTPQVKQSVTARRVRGATFFGLLQEVGNPNAGVTTLEIAERVHVGIYDLTDGSVATPVDFFFTPEDANERFLWERHAMYDVTGLLATGTSGVFWLNVHGAGRTGAHPFWSDVDVQANRRLNEGEALLYTVQYRFRYTGTPVEDFPAMLSLPYLRTLART